MEVIKELFNRALSEGLIPFMMITKGTGPKRNNIRLLEIALFVIPIIYFGGKLVSTLENVTATQKMMQVEMAEAREDRIAMKLNLNTISTQLVGHLDFDRHGRYNGEEKEE